MGKRLPSHSTQALATAPSAEILAVAEGALALAGGDLSQPLVGEGPAAAALKSLQASLRRLTWQVHAIAGGDLSQRVESMGEFTAAFNALSERLQGADAEVREQHAALLRRNADLQRKVREHREAEQALRESESRYRLLADNASDLIMTMDMDGAFTYHSPSTRRLLGDVADGCGYATFRDAVAPSSLPVALDALKRISGAARAGRRPRPITRQVEIVRYDGSTIWVEVAASILWDEAGRPSGILGVARDVTERRRLQQAETEHRLIAEGLIAIGKSLADQTETDGVLDSILTTVTQVIPMDAARLLVLDGAAARSVRSAGLGDPDPTAGPVFDIAPGSPLDQIRSAGRPIIFSADDLDAHSILSPRFASWIGGPLRSGTDIIGLLFLGKRQPGYYNNASAHRFAAFAGLAALALRNVGLLEHARVLAITDPLTGLFNRRHFHEVAAAEFQRAERYHHPIACVMLDIDHFKQVNDRYGHAAGDRVLQSVVNACRGALRSVDVMGRYGGEEFTIVLPETAAADAVRVAERLRRAVCENPIGLEGYPEAITISLGVSACRPGAPNTVCHSASADGLIHRADQAMYASKAAGRNRVTLFEDRRPSQPPFARPLPG
ncbi:MAG TPA: diguanylate cyclase [Armatimonadota bacterium]|jgi:diguanylate cyclase (GGDEF)-like protein/PAS domain S-box-containing protein